LLDKSTQDPLHGTRPPLQFTLQEPPEHTSFDAHWVEQFPQWLGSDVKSAQPAPQSVSPVGHEYPHVPSTHVAAALLGGVHA